MPCPTKGHLRSSQNQSNEYWKSQVQGVPATRTPTVGHLMRCLACLWECALILMSRAKVMVPPARWAWRLHRMPVFELDTHPNNASTQGEPSLALRLNLWPLHVAPWLCSSHAFIQYCAICRKIRHVQTCLFSCPELCVALVSSAARWANGPPSLQAVARWIWG